MKTKRQELESNGSQAAPEEGLICEACGRFDAVRIGTRALCMDCYQGCGSCCPEFGKDDLWSFPEENSRPETTEDKRP